MIETYDAVLDTPIGRMGVAIGDGLVTRVALALSHETSLRWPPRTTLVRRAMDELFAYFNDPTHVFSVPVAMGSTPFQKRVFAELAQIPVGETRTYGELARKLDTSARAVGGACRANPCPIFTPCHRAVASNGGLGGFGGRRGGEWLNIKRDLLRLEGAGL